MKKFVLLLAIAAMAMMGYTAEDVVAPHNDGNIIHIKNTAPLSSSAKGTYLSSKKAVFGFESVTSSVVSEPDEEQAIEQSLPVEDIPLDHNVQDLLLSACEEFDIPYALVLGLIETESTFRNLIGDDGASVGYMQIQQKWHWRRMERLGVTNLLDPEGNFRVGCDFLSELYEKYNDWSVALTVYNFGHDPGYITDYAKEVMENYDRWKEIINNDI